MRLSALNIWGSWAARRAQQEKEVSENSSHDKRVWKRWEHNGWGNNIQWVDWDKRKLYGLTTPLPCVGDELREKMKGGGVGVFRFKSVEPCYDPSDMWFGEVEDVGYEDSGE